MKTINEILVPEDNCLKVPGEHCGSCLSDFEDNSYLDMNCCSHIKWRDQALKELGELLLECKPEKKTKKDVPDPYEVGIHATIPVAQASGYNQAIDDYEKNIKEVLK